MPQQLAVLAYETTQAVCTPHPLPRAQPPARLLALERVHLTLCPVRVCLELCAAPGPEGEIGAGRRLRDRQLCASVQGMWSQAGLPPALLRV